MSLDAVNSVVGFVGLIAALLSVVSLYVGLREQRAATRQPPSSVTDRIERLRTILSESASLVREIDAEIQLEATALDRIRAEAEDNRRLASLHQQEAGAVKALIDVTIKGAQGKVVAQNTRQQWLFFIAGLLLAVPIGVIGNFIFTWLN